PRGSRLVVNDDEAVRVRAIFALYLEYESLLPVVQELQRRGWVNKRWITRDGRQRGGAPFTPTNPHRLLTNVACAGRVRYKGEVSQGEHPGIVDVDVFGRVQQLLQRNARTGGAPVRNQFGALLKGLLRCTACNAAMIPSHTTKQRVKRYRYYTCSSAQQRGWDTCPAQSIPAAEIEQLVVGRIKVVGQDSSVLQATV